ncbi:MAG: hypothetical protein MMC33_006644 [Icmadophila ericetorum]|nr:hypothetical protein [Icmadophila ericetorum]
MDEEETIVQLATTIPLHPFKQPQNPSAIAMETDFANDRHTRSSGCKLILSILKVFWSLALFLVTIIYGVEFLKHSTYFHSLSTCDRQARTASILNVFLGGLGVDQFYAGHIGYGVGKLLTAGGLGIWWVIDVYRWGAGGYYGTNGCTAEGFAVG